MYIYTGVHLCFLVSVSREYWEYRTKYTGTSMFSSFCFQRILRIQNPVYMYSILSILWKQKQENIYVPVYLVLYSRYSLETETRKHRCTCILGSVFLVFSGNRKKKTYAHVYWVLYSQYSLETERRKPMFSSFCFQRILRIQNPVYMYIYVFFLLFPKHSENTEHSIHVHICFLLSVSREYWEYRTFSVFSGNRQKKT
jgi:peptidoglycan/LPS O-acetylase OafA/YrhL